MPNRLATRVVSACLACVLSLGLLHGLSSLAHHDKAALQAAASSVVVVTALPE